MKKNIWILNHYAGDMLFDKGGRHYYFAKYLKREGYDPVVFCANTRHGKKERWIETEDLWIEKKAEEIDTPFIYIKSKLYENNGKERIMNMIQFYHNVKKASKEYAEKNGKPDIILASSAHPLTLVAGIQLAKKYHVKCICEIRDLWPESIVAYKKLKKDQLLVKLMYKGEKTIYTKADHLIFTMEGAYDYILSKGWGNVISKEKISLINNGIDLEQFEENRIAYQRNDEDLCNRDVFKVVYTGSIRKANNIRLLLDAAEMIKESRIRVLVWGNGDELDSLLQEQKKRNIDNIVFKGRVAKQEIPFILCNSDAVFLDSFDDGIARYGISSNKLFEYMAAGKPVLMNKIPQYNPAEKYGCTVQYERSAESVAHAIEYIASVSKDQYDRLCSRAKKTSIEYSFSRLTNKLISTIEMMP